MRRAAAVLLALACPTAAAAHHSFAVFDLSRKVVVEGTVKAFEWTNPHLWIHLVVQENGKPVDYAVEGQSPNMLVRRGWSPTSLRPGDKVAVQMNPLRSGEPGGGLVGVRLADGAFLGQPF